MFGEAVVFALGEFRPRRRDGFGGQQVGETRGERFLEAIPIDVAEDRLRDAALEEQSVFGAFLRGAGDLGSGVGVQHVVEFRTDEADRGSGRRS